MKLTTEQSLQVLLADFLKTNGHGLLDSCHELSWWYLFLDYVAGFLKTDTFQTRGSCIAQTVIETLASEPKENEWDDTDIKLVLTPYIMVANYFNEKFIQERVNPNEKKFLKFLSQATRKRNIDIYIHLKNAAEVEFYAQAFKNSFNNPQLIAVSDISFFPNGIAALHVDVKLGYFTHEVVVAFKPPLKKDLRKNMSKRQLASKGKIIKKGTDWFLEVDSQNISEILDTDETGFLNENLSFSELMLQVARTLRFNAIYTPNGKTLLTNEKIKELAQALTSSFEKNVQTAENYILRETMNEFMLAFLHNPDLFIEFIINLPHELFPYINRETLVQNKAHICEKLSNRPKHRGTLPLDKNVNLTEIFSLLIQTKNGNFESSEIYRKYHEIISSIDSKIGLTEMLDQESTHTTWNFAELTDFYYFFLLFYPVQLEL